MISLNIRSLKLKPVHLSMKWKLILVFAAVTLTFLGVAVYQGHKINKVEGSMVTQKSEMEKQITVSIITQMLQELNRLETSLAESSDLEIADTIRGKQTELEAQLSKVEFAEGTPAGEKLQTLHTELGQYNDLMDQLETTMQDESLDPLTVLEKIDDIHTQALAVNANLLETNAFLYHSAADNAEIAEAHSFSLLDQTVSIVGYAAGGVFLFTLILAILLIRSFLSPVSKLQSALRRMADGDLSHQINSPYNDELGRLSAHFDHMASRVRDMLRQTLAVASSLADYSHSFKQSSTVTAHTNQDIVKTIQEISLGADQQAVQSEHSTQLLQELEQQVDEIICRTDDMLATSETANLNTRKGAEMVTALRDVSEHSRGSIGKVYQALEKLVHKTGDISRISGSITEISKQTNILSLNAAIEAARAGAAGRGFGVIADEVRHLSEQTNESSIHISTIIAELQESMSDFQNHMLETKQNLEAQDHQVEETLASFQAIDGSITGISLQIGQIHEKVENTRRINTRLAESVHSVAAVAEQTAAGVQEVNASSTQQDKAIHDIARQAVEIYDISQRLFGEISAFKIEEGEISDSAGTPEAEAAADALPASEPKREKLPELQLYTETKSAADTAADPEAKHDLIARLRQKAEAKPKLAAEPVKLQALDPAEDKGAAPVRELVGAAD